MRCSLYLVSVLAFFCNGTRADAEAPHLTWVYDYLPPAYMEPGANPPKGFAEEIQEELAHRLPAYSHSFAHMPLARLLDALKHQDGLCTVQLIRNPEREAFIRFSDPVFHMQGNRLITLKDKRALFEPYLNAGGQVDTAALAGNPDLTVGFVADRFYSAGVNALIDRKTQTPEGEGWVKMPNNRYALLLLRGRIDYTFGYSEESNFLFKNQDADGAYTSFAVAGVPSYFSVRAGCSLKPVGRAAIDAINALTATKGVTLALDAYYERWLDPEALRDFQADRARMPDATTP